ncbi:MAG: hypothetical protein JRF63_07360 [Deltaproteobacteria bacterium]|nr:hypothetical protein [Deltaproteobacteria bacterium]
MEIEAERLTLEPNGQQVRAEGAVRITAFELELRAGSALVDVATGQIVLGPPLLLVLSDATVSGSSLTISDEARRLDIDHPLILLPLQGGRELELSADWARCEKGTCSLGRAEGSGCHHQPPAYRVRAQHVTIHPSGDIDLSGASLFVDDLEVMALPWLRVRPPSAAGFLPPRVAWDANGGLILGPAGQIPLADDLVLSGHAAVRTSQGFETSSTAWTPAGDATIDQLFDAPDNHVRARFHLTPTLVGATLTIDGDIVDGRQIIDNLTFDPIERARTHTESAALFSASGADWFLTETRIELVQAFAPDGQLTRRLQTPAIGVAAELLPVVQSGPIWPALAVELERRETGLDVIAPDAAGGIAPAHTRVTATPSLAQVSRLGPIAGELTVASLHQLWLPDLEGGDKSSRHLVAASTELELPLIGHPGGLRHVITPLARYRIVPWINGRGPDWIMDDLDRLRRGHGVEAGIRTSLGTARSTNTIELTAFERVDLPGFQAESGPAYLQLSAAVGPRWLRLSSEGSWDHRQPLPSHALVVLSTTDDRGNRLETGGGWYGPGRGEHLDRGWDATNPWITGSWVRETDKALELVEGATLALTRRLRASAGALVGIIPDAGLHALWYGLELGAPCGCLTAGIVASHRLGSWTPDVMATISLGQL